MAGSISNGSNYQVNPEPSINQIDLSHAKESKFTIYELLQDPNFSGALREADSDTPPNTFLIREISPEELKTRVHQKTISTANIFFKNEESKKLTSPHEATQKWLKEHQAHGGVFYDPTTKITIDLRDYKVVHIKDPSFAGLEVIFRCMYPNPEPLSTDDREERYAKVTLLHPKPIEEKNVPEEAERPAERRALDIDLTVHSKRERIEKLDGFENKSRGAKIKEIAEKQDTLTTERIEDDLRILKERENLPND